MRGEQSSAGLLWLRRRIIPKCYRVSEQGVAALRINEIEPWANKCGSGWRVDGSQAARAMSSSIEGRS